MSDVATMKAHVKDGRLVLDEPTDLPEGTVVELVAADPSSTMDAEERAKLHRVLAESRAEHEAGLGIPAEEVLAHLRSL